MGCWLSGPWTGDPLVSGRSLVHLSQQDALRIIETSQRPITLQFKSQRGRRSSAGGGSWEPLPLNLHHLNLPLPLMGPELNTSSPSYQDRHYFSRLPQDPCDGGRCSYLPDSPQDTVDINHQDLGLTTRHPRGMNCLMGCCGNELEEPATCHSQTDDEDFVLEKPHAFLPLHHELDSGLGWTDGSLHQGDLSGVETEEGGLDDCYPQGPRVPGGCGGFGGGGSPSSESFISSELSDSGFYSVSTGEFRHFQRLLERRMRLYNARMQHQGEPCERRERRDSCPKSHRELLEAIPETLTVHPPCQRLQHELEQGAQAAMEGPGRGLFRVSSVQFHKADRPCLNRHSSSSGALFNPSHTQPARLPGPVLSTCSTPSSHRRPPDTLQAQHQGSSSVGVLRRSRTLHHRPPPQEYRRRASHPASPSHCAATLHHCGGVAPKGLRPSGRREVLGGVMVSSPSSLTLSPQQHPNSLGHVRGAGNHQCCYDNSQNTCHDYWLCQERGPMPETMANRDREMEQKRQMQMELEKEQKIQEEQEWERQQEVERSQTREQKSHSQVLLAPAADVNVTWPKPASRQMQSSVRGLYSTLEGRIEAGSAAVWEERKGQMDSGSSLNPNFSLNPKLHPSCKPNAASRRNQLLRERASQLADERSGMSTDEETNVDKLLGRYWSRTERREHFLLAREQKQQQLQARGASVREVPSRAGDGGAAESRGVGPFAEGRCNTVLEMSQRKLSRLRNRKLLDDWTTVEELLTHGTRLDNLEHLLCPSSLLTVTTV